jgi:hypothetical protein
MPYSYMGGSDVGGGASPFLQDTVELTNIAAASYAILLSYWLLAINSKLYIICATSIGSSGGGGNDYILPYFGRN